VLQRDCPRAPYPGSDSRWARRRIRLAGDSARSGIVLSAAWPWLAHVLSGATRSIRPLRHCAQCWLTRPGSCSPCLLCGAPVMSRQALGRTVAVAWASPAYAPLLAAADTPAATAHGDFHFNQILWHKGRVTALLDLEMSHVEAPDWDLGPFLIACLDPPQMVPDSLGGATKPEDYRDAPAWLQEAYPEMFAYASLRGRCIRSRCYQALAPTQPFLKKTHKSHPGADLHTYYSRLPLLAPRHTRRDAQCSTSSGNGDSGVARRCHGASPTHTQSPLPLVVQPHKRRGAVGPGRICM